MVVIVVFVRLGLVAVVVVMSRVVVDRGVVVAIHRTWNRRGRRWK